MVFPWVHPWCSFDSSYVPVQRSNSAVLSVLPQCVLVFLPILVLLVSLYMYVPCAPWPLGLLTLSVSFLEVLALAKDELRLLLIVSDPPPLP